MSPITTIAGPTNPVPAGALAVANQNRSPETDLPPEKAVTQTPKADPSNAEWPEDRTAEARVLAIADWPATRPSRDIDDKPAVTAAPQTPASAAVADGVRDPAQTGALGEDIQFELAVVDSIPDKIIY